MRGKLLLATLLMLVLGPVLAPTDAAARPLYRGKVSLTGFYYTEDDGVDPTLNIDKRIATNSNLGLIDLRATVLASRLWKERLDFKLDFRLRVTGSLDFERKFDSNSKLSGDDFYKTPLGISARGYLGGREYDLREAYITFRPVPTWHLSLGRMYIAETDAIKVDGVRVGHDFGPHWSGSAFFGGYPNPYSRSLLTDYTAPCGDGVAGLRNQTPTIIAGPFDATPEELATQQCQSDGGKFGLVGGAGARYSYDVLWGTVGAAASFFFGPGDGGPVGPNFSAVAPMGQDPIQANLQAPSDSLDAPRVFVSWFNSWRPHERVDLMSDLVIDLYGSAGPQLTRAVILSSIRALSGDRLTIRLGYSHMSSLAINMYLARLVYNRSAGTSLSAIGASAVENNLTVLRTGRDEGRVTLDSRFFRRLGGFIEGRVRARALINGDSVNDVYNQTSYTKNTSNLAGDVSLGVRDTGSIAGVRASLVYSLIFDYRAQNHVVSFDVGRDFWKDRITASLGYTVAITTDQFANNDKVFCTSGDPFSGCFGKRSGMTHEASAQIALNPWRTLFFLADYRLIAMTSDDRKDLPTKEVPTVITHAILFRSEFRW